MRLLPESHGAAERLDLPGVALVTVGVIGWSGHSYGPTTSAGRARRSSARLVAGAACCWPSSGGSSGSSNRCCRCDCSRNRAFAVGNVTTFLMSGATFAAAFLITQEFQFARGYSPISTGLRLLPFFGTPMLISPLAGRALGPDRAAPDHGHRPDAAGSSASPGSPRAVRCNQLGRARRSPCSSPASASRWRCPPCPTAVLNSVAPAEMGKASGVNYMAQRFGAVFAIAIASAVFSAHGNLGSPRVTAGFQAALWSCVAFAALQAALSSAVHHIAEGTALPAREPVEAPLIPEEQGMA